jgi:hypothetical protein
VSLKLLSHPGQARKRIPYLRNFRFDWPVTDYLHRSMANRRAYLKKLSNAEFTDENGAGPSGTREDEDEDLDTDESDESAEDDDEED